MKRALLVVLSVGLFYVLIVQAQNRGMPFQGPVPAEGVLQTYDPGLSALPSGGGGPVLNDVSQNCGRPWDEGYRYSSNSILVEAPTTEEEIESFSLFIQQMEGAFNIEINQVDRNPNRLGDMALEEHRWEGDLQCEMFDMIEFYNDAGYRTHVNRQYKAYIDPGPISKLPYGPPPDYPEMDPYLMYQLPYPHGYDDAMFPDNEGGYVRSRYAMWFPPGQAPEDTLNRPADVLLVICDTGLYWRYPDFIANLWQNLGEDANGNGYVIHETADGWEFDWGDINCRDDDGNGYPDDVIGYDFYSHTPDPTHYQWEFYTHGTSVYGIAAEETYDGRHMAGTLFPGHVKGVVPVKVGVGLGIDEASAIESIYYASYLQAQGYNIVFNMSWGGEVPSEPLQYALSVLKDLGGLPIAAVGNSSDSRERYPAAYPEVLAVAASTEMNVRAWFSNFGFWCDVAAPGEGILAPYYFTTGGEFERMYYYPLDGTSLASPIVAAMAAMYWTSSSTYTADDVRTAIRAGVYTPEDYPWDPPFYWPNEGYWMGEGTPPGWGKPYYGQGLVDSQLLFEP